MLPIFYKAVDCKNSYRFDYFHRKKSAFKNAYRIAVENFDSESIVCTCAVFLDFLKIDSWTLKVDIESANYIVKNWKGENDSKILLRNGKNLKSLIGKLRIFLYLNVVDKTSLLNTRPLL